MSDPRQPASPPRSSNPPDSMPSERGWFSPFLGHPLWRRVILLILVVYPIFLVMPSAPESPWDWPVESLSPAVDALRKYFPIFDRLERQLVADGMGHLVPAVHHVFAIGYLFGIPIFVFLLVTVIRLSRDEMKLVAASVDRLPFMFYVSAFAFAFGVYWIAWGAAGNLLFHHEMAVVAAGVMFAAWIQIGLLAAVSLRAMCVVDQGDAAARPASGS